jgi:hypothetical protein
MVRLATGEEVVAGKKLPRRIGCIFGPLIGCKVKVVLRPPPRAARIVELVAPPDRTYSVSRDPDRYHQANQLGETRRGELEALE